MLSGNFDQCKKILQKMHFQVIRKLGKGGSGEVLLASKFISSVKYYAIKCISFKKCAKDPNLKRYVSQQIQAMCALNHPYIIQFEKSFTECGWHFIVMEYCDKGNLMSYQLKKPTKILNLSESLKFLNQIVHGTLAIHSRNIIHRDIKCENIFLKKDKDGGVVCKIGDFGFAKNLQETARTTCGTAGYMAPEVMKSRPYSFKADVWSIGVVFYYMIFGQYPFKSINTQKQIKDKCSQGFNLFHHQKELKQNKRNMYLQSFFKQIFQIDPNNRITLEGILCHPIFKKQTEASSDSTNDDSIQVQIQWSLDRIQFINETLRQILASKVLESYLSQALKFYLLKVSRIFLYHDNIQSFLQENQTNKLSLKIKQKQRQFSEEIITSYSELQNYRGQIKKIDRFKEGFNIEIQDFISIKQGYRNTVGKIFEEIHSKMGDQKLKTRLKFRVFCCHLINRVFKTGVQEEVFPNFNKWKNKNNICSRKGIDFSQLRQWIQEQRPQNLLNQIDNINKIFYHKK